LPTKNAVSLKKKLETMTIEELKSTVLIINEMISQKEPHWVISPDFVLLKVEKNNIDWAGESFQADNLTHRVKTTWTVKGKRCELESVAKGWITYGDSCVEEFDDEWLSDEPDDPYVAEFMEFVGKTIAKSFREEPEIEEIKEALEEEGLLPLQPLE
jgi:hypothetical protein